MRLPALAGLLMMAGCSQAPDRHNQVAPAPTSSAPRPVPAIDAGSLTGDALPAPELAGVSTALGKWSGDAQTARFGANGHPLFTVACDRTARQLVFTRYAPAPGRSMQIVRDMGAATYSATPVPGGAQARTATSDSFVDTLLKPGGEIGVKLDTGTVLAIPMDRAVINLIRACRRP